MGSMQVVFLFDLNACADFLYSPKEELHRRLLSVRLACLRLLSDFYAKHPNLKWGAKFFDSQGSKNQTMSKFAFTDLSLENFETLENEICVRYERHLSILQALIESSENNVPLTNNGNSDECKIGLPVKILQLALTQVLCEFQWETMDMWSPSYTKIKKRKKNFLFVFSDFKDNEESLQNFFGLNNSFSKPKFMNIFLPQSLRDSIVKKADIHLVLLNMCEDQKFMGHFSSKFLPLLCDVLHSIHGSFIPLCIISQPLYNLKLLNDLDGNSCLKKQSLNLPTSYQNSFLPFSTLFEQCLYHPFYSSSNMSTYDCYIDFASKNLQIPIQIMEISNINPDLNEDMMAKATSSIKNKSSSNSTWLKFSVCGTVPRDIHFPASKVLLCIPNYNDSNVCSCGLQKLNKYLYVGDFSLLLECVMEGGKKLVGLLNSLSCDAAVISVCDPSVTLKLGTEFIDCDFLKSEDFQKHFLNKIQDVYDKNKNLLNNVAIQKPFQMECLDNKFKPRNINSFSSKSSNNLPKTKDYADLLKQSVAKNKHLKSKQTKQSSAHDSESKSGDQEQITDEKLPDIVINCDSIMKDLEELPPEISYEKLLSAIKDAYVSAIESSISSVTASETIMKMVLNYCKKHYKTSYEEHVSTILKENILISDQRSIAQKYENFDAKEAAEKTIKECQIQILLNLEIESLKLTPDKFHCVNTVTSLLRTAEFYFMQKEMLQLGGLKERRIFLNDILKKRYRNNLHGILEECIQEFEESESSPGSPAETISSEFNNEEELFSSIMSSNFSEKSSSSVGSCKTNNKDVKNKNTLERKLLRRRSDISDTARYRQVLLPKSSPKKKKAKVVANKGLRYSPRIAAKRNENNKNTSEKTNRARRNLFAGDKGCCTPKKKEIQLTPKSKKKNVASKTKLAAETPAHKQNYSALQRRKSFMESNSPKVVAESPTIRKTAKDAATKELLEKLLKVRQISNAAIEQIQRPPSFNEITPERKRRLSLKLFSKFLNSPTARQGIKKCTKRLFDQISPQKNIESCKKFKSSNESEEPSNLFVKNENPS